MAHPLPNYENPPVIEVVCGVLFQELASLSGAHLGLLWQRLQPEYDHVQEVPPLAPAIERSEGRQAVDLQVQLIDTPPLPRTWFLTKSEDALVQVQRDRFLHNWKRMAPGSAYPRYSRIIKVFQKRLSDFDKFLADYQLGEIRPLQYEMTYVNHIPQGDGWNSLSDMGNVFPDFSRRTNETRFLPDPDQLNWRTSFLLPRGEGRLHAVIRHVQRGSADRPIILLELTARGIADDPTRDKMWKWFDMAHEWIVFGFTDLTGKSLRNDIWRQTE